MFGNPTSCKMEPLLNTPGPKAKQKLGLAKHSSIVNAPSIAKASSSEAIPQPTTPMELTKLKIIDASVKVGTFTTMAQQAQRHRRRKHSRGRSSANPLSIEATDAGTSAEPQVKQGPTVTPRTLRDATTPSSVMLVRRSRIRHRPKTQIRE